MELIDKVELINSLTLLAKFEELEGTTRASVILGIIETVKKQKTVDAVPVVRCKDCKHADVAYCHDHKTISKTDVYCLLLENRCKNSFYCADGERETDAR